MKPLCYLFAACLVTACFVLGRPAAAHAEHQISLHLGRHDYSENRDHAVLGAEYKYKFKNAVSLGVTGDYLSADFGGGDETFRGLRAGAGPNLHFVFGCLPLDMIPGVGLEYISLTDSPFERDQTIGAFARLRVLVRVMKEFSAGFYVNRSWNAFDKDGKEWAGVVQFNIGVEKKKDEERREREEEIPSDYVNYRL